MSNKLTDQKYIFSTVSKAIAHYLVFPELRKLRKCVVIKNDFPQILDVTNSSYDKIVFNEHDTLLSWLNHRYMSKPHIKEATRHEILSEIHRLVNCSEYNNSDIRNYYNSFYNDNDFIIKCKYLNVLDILAVGFAYGINIAAIYQYKNTITNEVYYSFLKNEVYAILKTGFYINGRGCLDKNKSMKKLTDGDIDYFCHKSKIILEKLKHQGLLDYTKYVDAITNLKNLKDSK